jgi:hypothetical protein
VLNERVEFQDNAKDDILNILNSEMAVYENLKEIEEKA